MMSVWFLITLISCNFSSVFLLQDSIISLIFDLQFSEHTNKVQFLSDSSPLIGLGSNSQTNFLTSEIDISVSKLLGIETFANVFRVSVSVSENMVSEKKFQFWFRKIWSQKKASVSVS